MLGIVDPAGSGNQNAKTGKSGHRSVVYYANIKALAQGPAYFGIILVRDDEKIDELLSNLLSNIAKYHQALPFRLMLVVQDEDSKRTIQEKVENKNELPVRRVHVISIPELFNGRKLDRDGWEKLIITIYDKWLWAYKRHELEECGQTCWHLGIGFQRSRETVLSRWNLGENGRIDLGFGWQDRLPAHLKVHLFWVHDDNGGHISSDGKENDNAYLWCEEDGGKTSIAKNKKQALALDNHFAVLPGERDRRMDEAIASYQGFEGPRQPALFHLLETPPKERFARTFLIFSIAEALLTNVVVVDERVAEGMIEEDGGGEVVYSSGANLYRHKARIFPVFHIHAANGDGAPTPLSVQLKEVIDKEIKDENNEHLGKEGVSEGSVKIVEFKSDDSFVLKNLGNDAIDIIVIHEGIIDTLDDWSEEYLESLYAICPAIVRTSGRGAQSRSLGQALPFLEFSELADTAQRGVDKVSLGRTLLSLRG